MAKPRVLLVGADQCDWRAWKTVELGALHDPFGYDTSALGVPVLPEPVFDRRFDGTVFCIPNYKKAPVPLICEALRSGLPTLIIKLRLTDAGYMTPVRALGAECRDRLWIGEHYRYQSGARAVTTAAQQGLCGAVEALSWRCLLAMPDFPPWMGAYSHLILEDLAYHHMTVVQDICPDLKGRVSAQSWSPSWLAGNRGYAAMQMEADAGWRLNYETRWGSALGNGNFFGELTVEGALGALWTDGERASFTPRGGRAQSLPSQACPYEGWGGIVDHFGDTLNGRAPAQPELLRFDRFDGVLRTLYVAVQSARTGKQALLG